MLFTVYFALIVKGELMSKEALTKAFFTFKAFQWDTDKKFRLASGITSPYYVDCRTLLADPSTRQIIAELAFREIHALNLNVIGGLEIGAIPLATSISDFGFRATPSKAWRTFVVRKEAKNHGLQKLIEGAVEAGDQALIVDDVLTSGGSVLKAIQVARKAGLEIHYALVIVDRQEQDGRKAIEQEGVNLISLLTLEDLKAKSPT